MAGVGATALLMAAARALETDRQGGLLSDPFARQLASPQGFELIDRGALGPIAANGSPLYVVRHRYFDEWLVGVTTDMGIRQVVLLAAGLDTRAFRLIWPDGTRVYEVDQPEVFRHKEAILDAAGARPRCDRRVVATDLRENWADTLVAAGFEPGDPSAWVAEGLLFYLPESAVHQLLDETYRLAAPGSYLAADMMTATPGPPQQFIELFASLGAPFEFRTDDPAALVGDHGWNGEHISMTEISDQLGVELRSGPRVVIARR